MTRLLASALALAVTLGAIGSAAAQSLATLADEARQVREQAAPPPVAAPQPRAGQTGSLYPDVILTVPASAISPGETISDRMLEDRVYPAGEAQRYPQAANRASLVGKVAKRMLMPGQPVPVFAVADAKLITQGVPATIRFEEGGLSIRAIGMPMESGTVGAVVRLKNIDSGHMVTGIVQSDGTVKVGG